jgi:hypothetical protein
LQQLMEFFEDRRIEGELRAGAMNGAVGSPLVALNTKFRPRHDVLLFAKPLSERHWNAPQTWDKNNGAATAGCGLPVLSGLAKREEHHGVMIAHSTMDSSIAITEDGQTWRLPDRCVRSARAEAPR